MNRNHFGLGRKIPLRLWYKVFFKTLGLLFTKTINIVFIEPDQALLFIGGKFSLVLKVDGACYIKVYINDILQGTYVPNEYPALTVSAKMNITIKAFNLYGNIRQGVILRGNPLEYSSADRFNLNKPFLTSPQLLARTPFMVEAPQLRITQVKINLGGPDFGSQTT